MSEFQGSAVEGSQSGSLQARLRELLEMDPANGSAHALDIRAEARRPMRGGITEDEYRTVIEVLQWIVANLGPESRDKEAR